MIIIYSFVAIFIAWIWVDYYRLIDVFEREKLRYLIATFFFGCCSVPLVFIINDHIPEQFILGLNGTLVNDFLYATLGVGAVEELAKTLAFLASYLLFRKQYNEPIDYLAYVCTAALGFSAVENILYFERMGAHIISGRSILSTVGHMFDTALVAYGIILYKYHPRKYSFWIIPLFFLFATLAHGLYDFWIMYRGFASYGFVILIIYFMYTLSFFTTILNNAINNSHLFTYKTTVDPVKVSSRLLTYYILVFALEFALVAWQFGLLEALNGFRISLFTAGFVAFITSIRLSRFRLIEDHWHPLRFELPFETYTAEGLRFRIRIKGESRSEALICKYYHEHVVLQPLDKHRNPAGFPLEAYIADMVFLKNEHPYFPIILKGENANEARHVLIPKTYGPSTLSKLPILILAKSDTPLDHENFQLSGSEFIFLEKVILKPLESADGNSQ